MRSAAAIDGVPSRDTSRPAVWLGTAFFGWMYGTPLLFLGLAFYVEDATPWPAAAWSVLAIGVPAAGLATARRARRDEWRGRFAAAVGIAMIAVVCGVGALASASEDGAGRTDQRPPATPNPYQDCVNYSAGGPNYCPGG